MFRSSHKFFVNAFSPLFLNLLYPTVSKEKCSWKSDNLTSIVRSIQKIIIIVRTYNIDKREKSKIQDRHEGKSKIGYEFPHFNSSPSKVAEGYYL